VSIQLTLSQSAWSVPCVSIQHTDQLYQRVERYTAHALQLLPSKSHAKPPSSTILTYTDNISSIDSSTAIRGSPPPPSGSLPSAQGRSSRRRQRSSTLRIGPINVPSSSSTKHLPLGRVVIKSENNRRLIGIKVHHLRPSSTSKNRTRTFALHRHRKRGRPCPQTHCPSCAGGILRSTRAASCVHTSGSRRGLRGAPSPPEHPPPSRATRKELR
jgi:hypothetical protein